MEQPNQFRSSIHGFNREDVVRYMEFINNRHSAQVAQLTNEVEYLRGRQETLGTDRVTELERQLAAARAENEALRQRVQTLEQSLQESARPVPAETPRIPADSELEAYRRAERVERLARERARQIGEQTSAALGQTSEQLAGTAERLTDLSTRLSEELSALQAAVTDSRRVFLDAAGAVEQLQTDLEA